MKKITSYQLVNLLSEFVAWFFAIAWLIRIRVDPFWALPVVCYLIFFSFICPLWASKR